MASDTPIPVLSQHVYPFDARGVAKRFRHAAIFGALAALQPGETMRFCNDHDPLPLLQGINATIPMKGFNLHIYNVDS